MKVLVSNTIRSSLLLAVALAFGSVLTPACNNEDTAKPAAVVDKYATLDSFCATAGEVACNDDIVLTCSAKDATACAADFATACRKGATFMYSGSTAHYNEDAAEKCVTLLKTATEDGKIVSDEFQPLTEQCSAVFSPRLGTGLQCTSDFDCDDTNDLKCLTSAAGTRKCVKPVEGNKGEPCDPATTLCPSGFFCLLSDNVEDRVCRSQYKVGQTCVPQFDSCAEGLTCQANATGGGSTCIGKLGNHEACSTNDSCETGICEPASNSSLVGFCSNLIDISSNSPSCSYFDGE